MTRPATSPPMPGSSATKGTGQALAVTTTQSQPSSSVTRQSSIPSTATVTAGVPRSRAALLGQGGGHVAVPPHVEPGDPVDRLALLEAAVDHRDRVAAPAGRLELGEDGVGQGRRHDDDGRAGRLAPE